MPRLFLALALAYAICARAQDSPVVFKSDVALGRVDAQVLDENGRAVTGLAVSDFVLRIDGRVVPIRNFGSENMPIDILLLLDVSGSMQPHVERIASAAHEALNVLAPKDRVAIMVFDTFTRLRLPFRSSHADITDGLNRVLRSERFNGGTRITRAMLDAAAYVQQEARPDARRAIVILTDDETQDSEDEPRVESALKRANAVLSFLQAPYEVPTLGGGRRGPWGGGGGSWPGGGTGWPGGGTGWPGGGGRIGFPGGRGYGGDPSHTAGTATIANDSGGDTMNVDEASALQDTLARLRQRYTLNFYFPPGVSDHPSVRVDLSQEARMRFMDAEVRSREVFMAGASGEHAGPTVVTRAHPTDAADAPPQDQTGADTTSSRGHAVAVNEDYGPLVNTVDMDSDTSTNPSDTPPKQAAPPTQAPLATQASPAAQPSSTTQPPQRGGWPRADQQPPPPPKPN